MLSLAQSAANLQ